MRFCEKLEKFMQENEYTDQQLASTLEVTTLVIGKWQQGVSFPDKKTMEKLCILFNCELADLMDDPIIEEKEEIQETVSGDVENMPETGKTVQQANPASAESEKRGALYFINKSYDMLCDMSAQERIRCLCEVAVVGFVVLILGIILHGMLYGFINSLIGYTVIGKRITDIVGSIFTIVLVIMGGIIWVQLFKIRYLGNFITKEKTKKTTTVRDINQTMLGAFNILGKSVMVILKVFSVVCAIPMVILFVGLICLIVMSLYHIQYGILFLWVALVLLGINCFAYALIELAYRFITSDMPELMKLFAIAMVGLIIMGIGTGLTIATYIGHDTVTEFAEDAYMTEVITIPMEDKLVFVGDNIEYIIENLVQDIQIEIKYVNNVNFTVQYDTTSSKYKECYINQELKALDTYKLVLQDLKDNKIRSYNTAEYVKVTITTSQSNYNRLEKNKESLDKAPSNNVNSNSSNYSNSIEIQSPNR